MNTGKYKGENWGDEDESQQDIRWIKLRKKNSSIIVIDRIKECRENDLIDNKYGFDRLTMGEKTAYLINMHACEVGFFAPQEK